jgi:hypothetical protein
MNLLKALTTAQTYVDPYLFYLWLDTVGFTGNFVVFTQVEMETPQLKIDIHSWLKITIFYFYPSHQKKVFNMSVLLICSYYIV